MDFFNFYAQWLSKSWDTDPLLRDTDSLLRMLCEQSVCSPRMSLAVTLRSQTFRCEGPQIPTYKENYKKGGGEGL